MAAARSLNPRKLPAQRRSQQTVEALFQAATQVFERDGYTRGTTNRIAERAGVSIGTLYQYFPNKDAILVELTRRHLAEGSAVLEPLLLDLTSREQPLEVGLRALIDAMIALHRRQPRLHRILFEECPRPESLRRELRRVQAAAIDAVNRWLRRCPEVQLDNHRLAAELVVQTIESLTHGLVIHAPAGYDIDALAAEGVLMLNSYLRKPLSR